MHTNTHTHIHEYYKPAHSLTLCSYDYSWYFKYQGSHLFYLSRTTPFLNSSSATDLYGCLLKSENRSPKSQIKLSTLFTATFILWFAPVTMSGFSLERPLITLNDTLLSIPYSFISVLSFFSNTIYLVHHYNRSLANTFQVLTPSPFVHIDWEMPTLNEYLGDNSLCLFPSGKGFPCPTSLQSLSHPKLQICKKNCP